MDNYFNREKQQKILQKLKQRAPDFITEEDYDKILSLFKDEHELNDHLFDLKNRGLITATFIPTLTGHILELSSLAYVNK